jgi:hypothetical protein
MSGSHEMPVVLAIAPTSRGFGYIVFENGNMPFDWGVKNARENKSRECLSKLRELLDGLHPAPSVLVLEDTDHVRSRRAKRIRVLIERIADLAEQRGIRVMKYSREDVLDVFGGEQSKHDVAEALAMVMPALSPRLPPRRRVWESEHYSMAIFEAAALAQTYFALGEGTRRTKGSPAFHAAPTSSQLESRRMHESAEADRGESVRPKGVDDKEGGERQVLHRPYRVL